MRVRLRGPNGLSTLSLADDATIGHLKQEIASNSELPSFELKMGYPPKPLDLEAYAEDLLLTDSGLKLNGEQLIVSKRDIASTLKNPLRDPPSTVAPMPTLSKSPISTSKKSSMPSSSTSGAVNALPATLPLRPKPDTKSPTEDSDPPELPMAALQGTLVLRVMPDDNSCLFRALSYAVLGDLDSMHEIRGVVASVLQADQETYTDAILDKPRDEYCRWIQRESSWGGAIELNILSQHFGVEIASIDIEGARVDRFNEGAPTRCILAYSGIHYDCIVLNPSSPPYKKANATPEFDVKIFDANDTVVVDGALELCKILRARNYYTNTATFTIICNTCNWKGTGEKELAEHMRRTGHNDFQQT